MGPLGRLLARGGGNSGAEDERDWRSYVDQELRKPDTPQGSPAKRLNCSTERRRDAGEGVEEQQNKSEQQPPRVCYYRTSKETT
ncbi:hypothetical protein Q5P01_010589 [Channa striata]|uniref:Uncharacterized protein n=1 Tax=Channa striata TaxID=64152 RepID=A0AA88N4X7_CHASR|nr:hypothetical protein Q5P01_010589 [Channa striata]